MATVRDVRRVTIVDVARRAGTSTAVVSYVLNPGGRPVSEALRARVIEAIADLDYRPHRRARALRRRTGWGQFGLLIPDVTLPFYGMLAGSIESEARARRQLVLTGNTGFDTTAEVELARSFADAGVDGLLVAGIVDGGAVGQVCDESRIPLVWVHSNRGATGPRIVCSDHVRAGALAAEHLVGVHGRTSTAFVGGFTDQHVQHGDRDTVRQRFEGYASIAGGSGRHIATDLTLAGAYCAVRAWIEEHGVPDGLVVGTFLQSGAVLRALTDAGLRVPDDVPVVGFDGDARNAYAQIAITTVHQDIGEIARRGIDLALPANRPAGVTPTPLHVALTVADSCGCNVRPQLRSATESQR